VSPADAGSKAAILAALRASQNGWKQLGAAAGKHNDPAYKRAQDSIAQAEADLKGAVAGLAAAGYRIG
jgi:hypothetical protein